MGLDSVIYQKVRKLDAKKQEQILHYIEMVTKKETMNRDKSCFQAFPMKNPLNRILSILFISSEFYNLPHNIDRIRNQPLFTTHRYIKRRYRVTGV